MNTSIKELRAQEIVKLHEMVLLYKKNLMNLRFQKAAKAEIKTHGIRVSRRTIARIKTVMNEKKKKGVNNVK